MGQRQLVPRPPYETERGEPLDRSVVEHAVLTVYAKRLVEAQAEHHALAAAGVRRQLLDLPRRQAASRQRGDVHRQPRWIPPPPTSHRRNGSDPDAEVVPAEPIGEVVPRAQIPHACRRAAAEVRRLVPPVPGRRQPCDDPLEVALERLCLAGQLLPVPVREASARLCLQLVAGEVLRTERECLVDVAVERGGALAWDPVDEIERDVVKSGITEMVEGAPDVVRAGLALEHSEERPVERLS